MSRVRRTAATLMVAYLLVVGWVVFWPSADPAMASVSWMSAVLGSLGGPAWLSGAVVEFLANVLLFVPLSFLGSFLVRRWGWRTWLVTGLCASALVELGQLLLLTGRSATVVDVVANTLGALLGATLALPLRDRALGGGVARPPAATPGR